MKTLDLKEAPSKIIEDMNTYGPVFGELSSSAKLECYDPKEEIILSSRPIRKLRFLLEGKAKISLVHENGNQSIVHFAYPGEYLGELTLLEIEKAHKNIHAITECIFLAIDMDQARSLKHDPEFLFKLCQFIGDKMLKRTSFNAKNQNYELRNRLAAYILATEHNNLYTEKHTETAEYLAVSYRHLLHTIKTFVNEGLICKMKKGYRIDKESLKTLAKDITML